MARRIAAILLLEPAFDESYERVKAYIIPRPSDRGGTDDLSAASVMRGAA